MIADAVTVLLIGAGLFFFVAGTVGFVRFPDVHSRLHALTKADNLGLGLVVLGAALQAPDAATVLKLVLVWLLTLAAAATVAQLLARSALEDGAP
ncbi:monovalent cation/H(+) antiporter subunit G [Erythrobacteraceae bacterium CFH 75059]|uniref:monovalent cation/H(+) antiporter subunit G n=1 Tax=Qipengyuania thermophila TaxID=2509361 RepID=UPI0010222F58|nr:monovalent cation/H(+) antiporter subunit G [Qipengyuania thermophila]TCD06779.1 monovalent cation/H(+) antiporter subunit G [Erythrobacteraceae bacterium CFH 75059]